MNVDCSLCNELIDEDNILLTNCNHKFHQHCFIEYQNNFQKCPVCGKNISEEIFKIFNFTEETLKNITDEILNEIKRKQEERKNNINMNHYNKFGEKFSIIDLLFFISLMLLYVINCILEKYNLTKSKMGNILLVSSSIVFYGMFFTFYIIIKTLI